jgi:hypothetical protein
MIGKLILGLLLLMAAAVIVNPELSIPAWNFALAVLTGLFYFGIIACVLCIGLVVILAWKG